MGQQQYYVIVMDVLKWCSIPTIRIILCCYQRTIWILCSVSYNQHKPACNLNYLSWLKPPHTFRYCLCIFIGIDHAVKHSFAATVKAVATTNRLVKRQRISNVYNGCKNISYSYTNLYQRQCLYQRASSVDAHNLCASVLVQSGISKEGLDDTDELEHFPQYWHFVRRIHWSAIESLPKELISRNVDVFIGCHPR